MATAAKAEASGDEAPKKKKKLVPIIVAAALVLGGGGGGGWYYMKSKAEDADPVEEVHSSKKARVFLPLDAFTVNLGDELNRFAQVAMTLELISNEVAEEVKVAMPAVRDRILRLVASQSSARLLSNEGKLALAEQIGDAVAAELGWQPAPAKPLKKKVAAKAKSKSDHDSQDDDEDADEIDDAKSAGAGKGGRDGKGSGRAGDKTKSAKAHAAKANKSSRPHPVSNVHFTQFIVQ